MPCYSPIKARRRPDGSVVMLGSVHEPALLSQAGSFALPCGRCIGCRLKYSQMWAIRCVHEASMYDQNCCVTLTYSDDHLPEHGDLVYRDFQLFMKRLRQKFKGRLVRFFCGGEYGDKTLRPHFHALLFNFDFSDKVVYSERGGRPVLWSSAIADGLWRCGNVVVGEASFDSAAYIARYVTKKVYGDLAEQHYTDPDTGYRLTAEFAHMSLKNGGIGIPWLRKFGAGVARELTVVSDGKELYAPRAYVNYLSDFYEEHVGDVQEALKRKMAKLRVDNTPKRLHTKARVAAARLGLSRRVL